MRALALALRYAKGLFIVAKELNKTKEFGEDLQRLEDLLRNYPEIFRVLESPIYPPDVKMEILREIVQYIQVDPEVERFLQLLVERRRIQYLKDIIKMYQSLLDEELGIARGEVVCAYEISDEERRALEEALKEVLKKEVYLEVRVDPGIIGGALVRIGDYVWDGTLKSQLEKVKEIIRKGV